MGVCKCSVFYCTLLYVHSSIAIILMGKRELIVLFSLSSWCLVIVVWLFLAVSWVCLQFVIVVFPNRLHSKGVFLLWIIFAIYVSSLSCCLVCSLLPCGHLLGKG